MGTGNIVSKVLDSIDYKGDRQDFMDKFITLISREALTELADRLPEDKRGSLKNDLANVNDLAAAQNTLSKYFQAEECKDALSRATVKSLAGYIESITPELSDQQRTNLKSSLQSLVV